MSAFMAVTRGVLEEALRRKVYYGLIAFTLVLILMVPILPSAKVGVQLDLMREGSLGLLAVMSFLLAAIFGATMLSFELERKIVYNILSKPIRRSTYFLGKYLGIIAIILITLVFSYLVILLFIYLKFHIFNPGIYKALFTIFMESAVLAAFTLSLSTVASPVVSFFSALAFYAICHLKGEFLYEAMKAGNQNLAVRALAAIFYYLLPNLNFFNINETVAHGERAFPVHAREIFFLFLLALIFTGIFLWLGTWLFKRREL